MTTETITPTESKAKPVRWNSSIFTKESLLQFVKEYPTGKITLTNSWAKQATIDKFGNVSLDGKIVVAKENISEVVKREYSDPKIGMVGRDKLFERLSKLYIGISRRQIAEVLRDIPAHTLTQPVFTKRVTKPIVVLKKDIQWQMDLIDMAKYETENKGYKYALNIIDLFTKQLISIPLKNKEGSTIARELQKIFANGSTPKVLQSDNGSEFKNKQMEDLSKQHSITQVFSKSYTPQSQGGIERCNQTLKKMIHRSFITNNNYEWVSLLPDFVSNYNTSTHTVIKTNPNELANNPMEGDVKRARKGIKHQAEALVSNHGNLYKKGDSVRIALKRLAGVKDFVNWTDEIYQIAVVHHPNKTAKWAAERYKLNNGKTYARQELLQVSKPTQLTAPMRAIKPKPMFRKPVPAVVQKQPEVKSLPPPLPVPTLPASVLANLPLIPANPLPPPPIPSVATSRPRRQTSSFWDLIN